MVSQIYTTGLMGIDGFIVDVQADISNGMPVFDIIGLPDAAVKEAKERAKTAIKNSGCMFPAKRITMNLAPASTRKEGSSYDLPIAMAVLLATGQVQIPDNNKTVFIGEVSLDGSINSVSGVLPMVISAYNNGFKKAFVPFDNADEAAVVEGIEIYPVKSLKDILKHFSKEAVIPVNKVDLENIFSAQAMSMLDFAEVKGQENVKRALEIAAAGNHNVMLIGSPGTGKTMLAQRMPGILPDLTFEESLETTKIHSIAGTLSKETPLITSRPFRSPHHTISAVGLSGGSSMPKPGELSLAHNGILFLDELPEFRRDVLEVLRQPLEDGKVTISRVNATLSYPCNIMLIASMNPCKCGYFSDPNRECTCTPNQINNYRHRVSGPLLDRIDIQVEVASVKYDELSSLKTGETSAEIKKRINRTRKIQLERYKDYPDIYSNSQLTSGMIQKFCELGEEENAILKTAFESLKLSARAHSRILKVARTIADLEQSERITTAHIAEAIQYRSLDRKFFG